MSQIEGSPEPSPNPSPNPGGGGEAGIARPELGLDKNGMLPLDDPSRPSFDLYRYENDPGVEELEAAAKAEVTRWAQGSVGFVIKEVFNPRTLYTDLIVKQLYGAEQREANHAAAVERAGGVTKKVIAQVALDTETSPTKNTGIYNYET